MIVWIEPVSSLQGKRCARSTRSYNSGVPLSGVSQWARPSRTSQRTHTHAPLLGASKNKPPPKKRLHRELDWVHPTGLTRKECPEWMDGWDRSDRSISVALYFTSIVVLSKARYRNPPPPPPPQLCVRFEIDKTHQTPKQNIKKNKMDFSRSRTTGRKRRRERGLFWQPKVSNE